MTIVLYNSTAEKDVLNKSGYLTQVSTLTGTLRSGCNVVNPSIIVELDTLPNFNYAYIQEFNRYYFLTDITNVNNKLWEIKLHCDVLFSHKTGILGLSCEVERNEFDNNLLLEDTLRGEETIHDITIIPMESDEEIFTFPKNRLDLGHCWVLYAMT